MSELPFRATRVVKAVVSDVLHWGLKAVWLELHCLDNGPLGCTGPSEYLAQRLGMGRRTVEEYRQRLTQLGLALKVPSTRGWHVTLPGDCIPAEERPSEEAVQACARSLALFLGGKSTATTVIPPEPEPTQLRLPPSGIHGYSRSESTATTVDNPGPNRESPTKESTTPTGDSRLHSPGQSEARPPGGLERLEEVGEVKINFQPEVGGSAHAPETATATPGKPQRLKPELWREFGSKQPKSDDA